VKANSNGSLWSSVPSASHSVTTFANPVFSTDQVRPSLLLVMTPRSVPRKRRPGFAGSTTIEWTGMSGMAVVPVPSIDLAEIAFAGTDIEHIGVRRVNRHRVDGDVGDPVGEGSPGLAAVGCFPYAA